MANKYGLAPILLGNRHKMKITVIHPEGNINNNPHLSGFVDLLCESGFDVQVISPIKPQIYQNKPIQRCT